MRSRSAHHPNVEHEVRKMSRNSAVLVRGGSVRASTRRTGGEFRALAWLLRHPLTVTIPALAVAAVHTWGHVAVDYSAAGLLVVLVVWWRAHPASFDRWLAPW